MHIGCGSFDVNRTRIEVDGSPSTYSVPVLYVADYGNSRVQMLRLSDGHAIARDKGD